MNEGVDVHLPQMWIIKSVRFITFATTTKMSNIDSFIFRPFDMFQDYNCVAYRLPILFMIKVIRLDIIWNTCRLGMLFTMMNHILFYYSITINFLTPTSHTQCTHISFCFGCTIHALNIRINAFLYFTAHIPSPLYSCSKHNLFCNINNNFCMDRHFINGLCICFHSIRLLLLLLL